MLEFEKSVWEQGYRSIAGIDEVGREAACSVMWWPLQLFAGGASA